MKPGQVRSASEPASPGRLGRGLAALLGDADDAFGPAAPANDAGRGSRRVPIEFLRRNADNPRTRFDEGELDELATSIRERGVIQPVLVRAVPGLADVFEIVAGERRWRAAQRAGLHEVPVVVIDADDRLALELAIIENVQRADLNALDEARGYERLVTQHGYSQSDLAATLGKSRSHVANTIRLLKLPAGIGSMIEAGELSAGHGRALLAAADPEKLAARAVAEHLNVREVERLAQAEAERAETAPARKPRTRRAIDPNLAATEQALQETLGMTVRIDDRGGEGEIRIRYLSHEQLDDLLRFFRQRG